MVAVASYHPRPARDGPCFLLASRRPVESGAIKESIGFRAAVFLCKLPGPSICRDLYYELLYVRLCLRVCCGGGAAGAKRTWCWMSSSTSLFFIFPVAATEASKGARFALSTPLCFCCEA